jgi:hypothetical protein
MSEYHLESEVVADPKRPWKAYAATATSFLAIFVSYWVADGDPFTAREMGEAFVAAAVGSGVVGGATFAKKNPTTRRTVGRRR